MKTKNLYGYPIRKENILRIDTSSPAHKGRLAYAIDFLCKLGTEVYAAYDGEVVEVVNGKSENTKDMNDAGNFVLLKHDNQEFSHYAHFQHKGIRVKKGDKIKSGDLLGFSGNTGFSFGPHLHFSVIKFEVDSRDNFHSLEIRWKRQN
jgi:murein DD-endopeptidase MepM/ murein hydrolase activator NlpD